MRRKLSPQCKAILLAIFAVTKGAAILVCQLQVALLAKPRLKGADTDTDTVTDTFEHAAAVCGSRRTCCMPEHCVSISLGWGGNQSRGKKTDFPLPT